MPETQKDVLIKYRTQNLDIMNFDMQIKFTSPPGEEAIKKISTNEVFKIHDISLDASLTNILLFFPISYDPQEVVETIAKILKEDGFNVSTQWEAIKTSRSDLPHIHMTYLKPRS